MLCLQNKSFPAMVEESEKTRLGSQNDDEGEKEVDEWWKKWLWLQRYSSHHRILLVGEGDFSFSSSLATAFGSASNVTATSLDSYDDLIRKYKKAKSNLGKLKKLGASLLHGVDATRMKLHADLRAWKFDRIIFNFPHAGFKGRESDVQLINVHRKLMCGFFHNASQMLRADGEVHVSHKTTAPYCHWDLEGLANWNCLKLIDQTAFESKNYPGYYNKRGDGSRCDEPFPLGLCSTFKFRFYPGGREVLRELMRQNNAIHEGNQQIYVSPVQMPVEFPLINESSVQLNVGSMQEILQRTGYDDGRFRSVPLPGLASEQHYVDVERTSVGDLNLFHGPKYQEYLRRTFGGDLNLFHGPQYQEYLRRTFVGDLNLFHGPQNQEYLRRTPVGDLNLFHGPQRQEYLRRLIHSFGRPWLDRIPLLNAGFAKESQHL